MKFTSKTKGKKELAARMRKYYKTTSFTSRAVATNTTGTLRHGKKKEIEPRSAQQNAIIFNSLKKTRNPVFYTNEHYKKGNKIFKKATQKFLDGNNTAIPKALIEVAKMQIKIIKDHIEKGISESGKMKKLKTIYKRLKDYNYGADKPILVRTGQLIESLTPGWLALKGKRK